MPAPAAPPTTAPSSGLKPVAAPSTAPDAAPMPPPVTARWPQVSPHAVAVRRMAARTMYLRMLFPMANRRPREWASWEAIRVELRRKTGGLPALRLPQAEQRRDAEFHGERGQHRRRDDIAHGNTHQPAQPADEDQSGQQ